MRQVVIRVALGAGAIVVVAGVAVALALAFGRPSIKVASSRTALASLDVGGLGSRVIAVHAVADGKAVPVVERNGRAWPVGTLPQGETVQVTAEVAAPSWLGWLVGTEATSSVQVRTPHPAPSASVVVASADRTVPVHFTTPVAAVSYAEAGDPTRTVHLSRSSSLVDVPIAASGYSGTVALTAAGRSWEKMPALPTTVSWFVPPVKGQPAALAVPAPGGTAASSQSPISLTFSEPVSKVLGSTHPTISPAVAGHWTEPDAYTEQFTPSGFGFGPDTQVTVKLHHAVSIVSSATDPTTATSYQFTVGPGSVLRLQQLLAQLGYLPLQFTPAPGTAQPTTLAAEEATVYNPLPGSFSWRWAGTPASLTDQWAPGQATAMTKGALMAFEAADNTYNYTVENESLNQMATASVWTALLQAALANKQDPYPYSYIYVTENLPETLTLWENGQVALTAAVNTGISVDPTTLGTFPIYLRYTFQIMRGTNPDGSTYADPVHWINYFDGSEAVHGFVRASYGFPQSLGCVELPVATAGAIFPKLAIGDLVTVAG